MGWQVYRLPHLLAAVARVGASVADWRPLEGSTAAEILAQNADPLQALSLGQVPAVILPVDHIATNIGRTRMLTAGVTGPTPSGVQHILGRNVGFTRSHPTKYASIFC